MTAPLLAIENLSIAQGGAPALRDVSLAVQPGEVVALLGGNGAGKSTLLQAVMGLVRPSAGTIRLAGDDLARRSTAERARAGIGYCPEGRRVFPGMSVRDNLEVAGPDDKTARAAGLRTVHALFPQLAAAQDAAAWRLSGGQQQMLAIGRALMRQPRLLLLDEPSLGLAPKLVAEVLARVHRIAEAGAGVLLAEQNARAALRVSDRGVVLRLGEVVAEGTPDDLLADAALADALLGG